MRISGRDEVREETGKVGEMVQDYLLVIGRRAQQSALFDEIVDSMEQ